jgi:hypothetical protein
MQNVSSKKIYRCRDFAAAVYLCEAQNPLTHCIPVYSILIHTGKGVGGESFMTGYFYRCKILRMHKCLEHNCVLKKIA